MSEQEAAAGSGRKVRSLNPQVFGNATPRVQELTVADLESLAQVARGAGTPSGALAELTADDIRSLEESFREAKLQQADALARRAKGQTLSPEEEEIFWGWSCCCCTPCCCCAAADVDPFE